MSAQMAPAVLRTIHPSAPPSTATSARYAANDAAVMATYATHDVVDVARDPHPFLVDTPARLELGLALGPLRALGGGGDERPLAAHGLTDGERDPEQRDGLDDLLEDAAVVR
jgi:hypothetical protein